MPQKIFDAGVQLALPGIIIPIGHTINAKILLQILLLLETAKKPIIRLYIKRYVFFKEI